MKDVEDKIHYNEKILYALSCLTDPQKIVVLASMLGYTQVQIGVILGVEQPAVSKLLKRGVQLIMKSRNKHGGL